MQKNSTRQQMGIFIMILSAVCTSTGQLMWKMAALHEFTILFNFIGIGLYGMGAVLMIVAFKFGDMSVLHPMLSIGFVIALFYGSIFLNEKITWKNILGVAFIITGMVFLGKSAEGD